MHSEQIPKTLQRELNRHAHKIDSYHMEEDFFDEPGQGAWSIWIGLNPEWWCPDMECGTIHEATARDAIEKLRGVTIRGRPMTSIRTAAALIGKAPSTLQRWKRTNPELYRIVMEGAARHDAMTVAEARKRKGDE